MKRTWNVHYSMRFTKDFKIEAETESEAISMIEDSGVLDENFNFDDWKYADETYDIWVIEDDLDTLLYERVQLLNKLKEAKEDLNYDYIDYIENELRELDMRIVCKI